MTVLERQRMAIETACRHLDSLSFAMEAENNALRAAIIRNERRIGELQSIATRIRAASEPTPVIDPARTSGGAA